MAKQDFGQLVGAHIRKYDSRMTAVFRQSAQDLIEEAQTPISAGGAIPVDSGFLRNSGQAALNNTPSGESIKPKNYSGGTWSADEAALIINRAQLGDRVIFGYVANYAIYMERRYGWVRLAAQNWPQIVKRNAERLRQRTAR